MAEKRRNRSVASATKRRRETIGKEGNSNLFNFPKDVETFEIDTADPVKIDIMPYEVGKGNPKADKGEFYWERTFHVHRNVGPSKEWVLCPARMLKQPCPVCEYLAKEKEDPDGDEAKLKPLYLSKRMLVNLITPKQADKVKVWHVSHAYFGKAIDEALTSQYESASENMDNFCDPDFQGNGYYLKLVTEKGYLGKGYKVTRVDFMKRPKHVPEDILDQAVCLDDVFVFKTYDEIKALLHGAAEDDADMESNEDFEETETKSSKKSIYDEDEDDKDKPVPAEEKEEVTDPEPVDDKDEDENWDD